jgi:hypothetical protein
VTPAGATWLDELAHGLRMADVIYAARPHGVYAPAADVVVLGGGEVVALDDPNGTPPAGKIGYWSKGRAVSLITASSAGRRLVIQDLGGGMLRTNAFTGLLVWTPAAGVRSAPSDPSLFGDDEDGGDDEGEGTDESDVHAHRSGDRVVFRFTGTAARTYRRYAGRRVRVVCAKVPPRPLLGEALTYDRHPASAVVRVPRHGGVIRGDAPADHQDLCVVETLAGGDVATGVLTAQGRRYVMDLIAPLSLALAESSPFELGAASATRYPGVATIVAAHDGLVPLATPGERLEAGQTGVWTDADQQALIATAAQDGLRYVLADEGHGMMRTNLYAGLLGLFATLAEQPS